MPKPDLNQSRLACAVYADRYDEEDGRRRVGDKVGGGLLPFELSIY